jgi:hypothetical protein
MIRKVGYDAIEKKCMELSFGAILPMKDAVGFPANSLSRVRPNLFVTQSESWGFL